MEAAGGVSGNWALGIRYQVLGPFSADAATIPVPSAHCLMPQATPITSTRNT